MGMYETTATDIFDEGHVETEGIDIDGLIEEGGLLVDVVHATRELMVAVVRDRIIKNERQNEKKQKILETTAAGVYPACW
jgi:hypothetical protein